MTIKNTGSKILNIGGILIVPEAISDVPDAFAGNSVIEDLVGLGFLAIVKKKAKIEPPATDPAKAKSSAKSAE